MINDCKNARMQFDPFKKYCAVLGDEYKCLTTCPHLDQWELYPYDPNSEVQCDNQYVAFNYGTGRNEVWQTC